MEFDLEELKARAKAIRDKEERQGQRETAVDGLLMTVAVQDLVLRALRLEMSKADVLEMVRAMWESLEPAIGTLIAAALKDVKDAGTSG